MKHRLFLAISLISVLVLTFGGATAFAAGGAGDAQDFAPDRILVKFQPGTPDKVKAAVNQRHGGSVIGVVPGIDVQVVKVARSSAATKARAYRTEAGVKFAELDYTATAIFDPSDTYYGNQWGMDQIQMPQAWDITQGSPAVKIAILDTGIDQDHPDLAAKIVANQNYTSSSTVDDLYGHGSHVAGIAAAITNNSTGVAGVGFDSSLMNVKVLDDSGSGYYSWISSGITWAADNGAKVINMSLGGRSGSSTLQSAVDYAWSKGVVVVAAAGNNGNSVPSYPAYYSNTIAVAATDQSDARASFSTYGSWVDVAAPGVNIFSTLPNHANAIGGLNYDYLSGTSMATPHVAGLAALIWATPYGTSASAVRSRIEDNADQVSGTGTYWQYGRINAYRAVAPPPPPPPPALSVNTVAPNLTNQMSFAVQATVSNSGGTTATAATATIELPTGLSTTASLTQALGDIPNGGSAIASWPVSAAADGTYTVMVNAAATNATSASGSATTTVDTASPAQVSGLSVSTVSSSRLDLSWNASTETDLGNYRVYRSAVSGGPYSLIASPASNSYSDSGLAAATTYYFVVSAVDKAGNEGPASVEASGSTSAPAINEMHVASIAMALKTNRKVTSALATVTVVDSSGNPVSGATVYGHWSGATSGNTSGLTGANGAVTFQSSSLRRPPSGTTFTFTVDSIALTGWTYNSGANVVSTASISVP
ncbi:MAG: S8 family serine peptidase [Chloroflexi bacterium]|nr:S8 family serine peptidase [Chloroflexota bacterium]